jgi:hypothetical protein
VIPFGECRWAWAVVLERDGRLFVPDEHTFYPDPEAAREAALSFQDDASLAGAWLAPVGLKIPSAVYQTAPLVHVWAAL